MININLLLGLWLGFWIGAFSLAICLILNKYFKNNKR
jgi:hypothetical protein